MSEQEKTLSDELVDVLSDALWALESYAKLATPEWDGSATENSVIGKVRAAIAKARGE